MAFTEALRLLIDADTRGAVRGIENVGKATEKELGRSSKTIDKWGRGLTTAGAGMVALGGAALLGLGKAAQASEEAELSVVKLQNSIANNPRLAGESADGFIELAESIQDKTAADADSIVAGQAVLAQGKLQASQIRELTPLVVDLARKKGIDEVSAFTLAAKAVDGNAGALKRAGISVDETAFKTDAYGATVEALRSSVGGFATEEGKTFQGSLTRMQNQLGDLAEGVGGGAVDAFTTMFGVVDDVTGALDKLSPSAQNTVGKFATFGATALVAAGGLSFMIGQAIVMRQRFSDAATAASGLAGHIGGVGRVARVAGGLVAIGLVAELIHLNNRAFPGITKIPRDIEDITRALQKSRAAGPDNTAAMKDFTVEIGNLDDALEKLLETSPGLASTLVDQAEKWGIPAPKIAEMRDRIEEYRGQVSETQAANTEWNESLDGTADAATDAATALQEYLDTLSGLFDPLFGATDALMENHEANAAVKLAELELAAAVRDHGASSLEATAAQQALTDAQIAAGKSALDVKQATAELSAAVDDGTVSVDQAKTMLASWVKQGLISSSTASALGAQFDTTAGKADELGATDPNVNVTASGVGGVLSLLDQVSTRIRQLDGSTAEVRVNARATSTGRIGGIPIFHQGIHRVPGRPGSEMLAYVQAGEEIKSAGMANMGGGGHGGVINNVTEIHVHVAGSVLSERALMSTINRQLDSGARLGKHGGSFR